METLRAVPSTVKQERAGSVGPEIRGRPECPEGKRVRACPGGAPGGKHTHSDLPVS